MNVKQKRVNLAAIVASLQALLMRGVRSSAPHLRSSAFPMLLLASGCAIGPDYAKPVAEAPTQWKEAGDWVVAQPKDAVPKGKWWEAFNDPVLNGLEEKVEISNQTLAAAEARYRQAKASVESARAGLFPTIGASAGATRSHAGSTQVDANGNIVVGGNSRTSY